MLYLVVAAVSIFLVLILQGPVRLATLRLYREDITSINGRDVPEDCAATLIEAERFLVKNGFALQTHVFRKAVIAGQPWGLYGAIYYSSAFQCWALCYVEPMRHPVFDYRLIFFNHGQDDRIVATISGSEFAEAKTDSDKIIVADAFCVSPDKQLTVHRQKCREIFGDEVTAKSLELASVLSRFEYLYFSGLIEADILVKFGNDYRVPLRQAFRVIRRVQHINRALGVQKQFKQITNTPPGQLQSDQHEQTRDWHSFETHRSIQANSNSSWWVKTGILFASVAVFGLAFGLTLSFETAFILIVVLLFHELGHLAGMWAFGYKNLSMLFVPFLGALVTGRKQEVSVWQEAIVLLLGPLPGYVLGLYLLMSGAADNSPLLFEFGMLALILNLFNLLPFKPLDGGQLIELALFSRYPRLQLAFLSISIVSLGLVAYWLTTYALFIIPILLAISFPFQYRKATLVAELIRDKENLRDEKDIFARVRQTPLWQKVPQGERWPLLENLLSDVRYAKSSARSCAAVFAVWMTAIALPPLLFLDDDQLEMAQIILQAGAGFYPQPESLDEMIARFETESEATEKADLAVMIVVRADFPESGFLDAEALEGNSLQDNSPEISDPEPAIDKTPYLAFIKQAMTNSTEVPASNRGRYASFLAQQCNETDTLCAIEYLQTAADIFASDPTTRATAPSPLLQGTYLQGLSYDEKLRLLQRLDNIIEQNNIHAEWNSTSKLRRAELEYEQRHMDAAESWLIAAVDDAKRYQPDSANYYWKSLLSHHYAEHQWSEAIETLDDWLAHPASPDGQTYYLITDNPNYVGTWLWSHKDPATARELLEKITPKSDAGKLEMQLALLTLEHINGHTSPPNNLRAIHLLVEQMDEYTWYEMGYRMLGLEEDYAGEEESPWYRHLSELERSWYREMGKMLERDEFSFIREKLEVAREEYY